MLVRHCKKVVGQKLIRISRAEAIQLATRPYLPILPMRRGGAVVNDVDNITIDERYNVEVETELGDPEGNNQYQYQYQNADEGNQQLFPNMKKELDDDADDGDYSSTPLSSFVTIPPHLDDEFAHLVP